MADRKDISELTEDLLYIHEDIKEVLETDSEVTQSILHKEKYKLNEVHKLHLKLLLSYIKHMFNDIDKNINKFKLANVKHVRENLARPKDTYEHLCRIEKPDKEQIDAASSLYETVLETKLKVRDTFKDLVKEEKDKFRNRYIAVAGLIVTAYAATLVVLPVNDPTKIVIAMYLIFGLWLAYVIMKNKVYNIEVF